MALMFQICGRAQVVVGSPRTVACDTGTKRTKHPLRGRRAANIAQADKQNFSRILTEVLIQVLTGLKPCGTLAHDLSSWGIYQGKGYI